MVNFFLKLLKRKILLNDFRFSNDIELNKSKLKYSATSLYSASSATKKLLNRDAFAVINNDQLEIRGVAIADGIGNNDKVNEASELVVRCMKTAIEQLLIIDDLDLEVAFKYCKISLEEKFGKEINNYLFGTTLIVVLEYSYKGTPRIKVGYVGNGAIWHIKGNFNHFDNNQSFPWNCVNYLNPHSVQQDGREALSNSITLEAISNYVGPSIMEFSCDKEFGDIIMICTDGIYSYDQITCSIDGLGKLWLQFEDRMKYFFTYLNDYFKKGDYTNESLFKLLNDYLNKVKDKDLLDDDATLGMIVLPNAIEYQKKLLNESNNKSQ